MAKRQLVIALDIQGFVDNNEDLIPKEIAWTSFGNDEESHAIIERPYAWEALRPSVQSVNDFLTTRKHGLLWELPGISYRKLQTVYRVIPQEINLVYVYDNKIADYLSGCKHQKIITVHQNLPNLETIEPKSTYCLQHQKLIEKGQQIQCAKVNASRIKQFVQTIHPSHPDYNQKMIPHTSRQLRHFDPISRKCAYPEFVQAEARTYSFFNWHKLCVNTKELINEGMFYTGENDIVQCYACGIKMGMWLPGDSIKIRHKTLSPKCITNKE